MPSARRSAPALTTQITALFGLLVGALAVVLALIFGDLVRQESVKRSATELDVIASNAAKLLAEGLVERSREIEVLTRSQALWQDGLDSPAVVALLGRLRAVSPNSLWIGVADAQGVVRAATGDLLLGENVAARPWFSGGRQGLYVGDVHAAVLLEAKLPAPASGDPLRFLDFAAPIRRDGALLGVLCAHVSWDWARQAIARILPGNAGERQLEIFIFDRAGELLYAPGGRTTALRAAQQRLPTARRLDVDRDDAPAEIVAWQDGERYLTAAALLQPDASVAALGWHIVAREPLAQSLAPLRGAVEIAFGIGCLVALLACGAAWLGARRLGRDLRHVARAAEEVEARRAGATIPVLTSSREVLALSGSLHRMTQRLLAANEEMERQVRQRTADLEQANRALELMARNDPLTGVLNRRGLHAQGASLFALARRSGRPLSLLMLDADHFKVVNDLHGHAIGDAVLQFLANCLRARLRGTDVIARWGGEEFVVLLPDSSLAQAQQIAEELRQAIMAHQHGAWGRITVSIGVAESSLADAGLEDLVHRADEALYLAKDRGRNCVTVAGALA
ncbi:sensor domain-containing diguanylate cyclase [Pseudorhodoferax sp. Leaf267]|uniref:sensor domain-containing diguanylate cyclase n=1 Tax=Pseudorhodoferax sp. Leaf267 TaxID=1736316 RepID=UPI0006FE83E5|nr:sensor domain-containing diguanylate cyclase [Pseudorhodoferax sp. Leaf267]KQP13648.1 hypothetical protein ASF43_17215 [Pseudorhodoferax sp. Leaf267]